MTEDLQRYAGLGLKVAITEADVRTFVNNATDQVPTDNLAIFAQPYEFGQMIKAALAVPACISFTVWGFGDADSWVPGFFTGEGYATPYDVNLRDSPVAEGFPRGAPVAAADDNGVCLVFALPGIEPGTLPGRAMGSQRREGTCG